MAIKIIKIDKKKDFLKQSEAFLKKNESFNSLMLGHIQSIIESNENIDHTYTALAMEYETVVGCATRTDNESPLILSSMPELAIKELVTAVITEGMNVNEVKGDVTAVNLFKNHWSNIHNLSATPLMHFGVFECRHVKFFPNKDFQLIFATEEHIKTVTEYLNFFYLECFPGLKLDQERVKSIVEKQLAEKKLYLLKNSQNEILSLASYSRSTVQAGTISVIYTPSKFRRNGYASILVGLVSQKILSSGKKFVNLYVDLRDTKSIVSYEKVGFLKVTENIHFRFH